METFWKQYLIAAGILSIGSLMVLSIEKVSINLFVPAILGADVLLFILAFAVGKLFNQKEHEQKPKIIYTCAS